MARGPRYLKIRHQTWYFQIEVPKDLRGLFKDEPNFDGVKITKSTGHHDVKLAQPIALSWAGEYKNQFNSLQQQSTPAPVTPREIYLQKLAEFETGFNKNDPEGELADIEMDLMLEALPKDQYGEPVDDPIARAKYDAYLDSQQKRIGKEAKVRHKYGLSFSEAARLTLKQKVKELSGQTKAQYESTHRLFSDYIGDKAIRLVSRQDAAKFLEEVSELDPMWGRGRDAKKLTFEEAKGKFGGHPDGLSNRTINRYITALSSVWKWAKARDDVIGDNPFSDLLRPVNQSTSNPYTHFTGEELTKLFAIKPSKRTLWEIPAVAVYSGMRLNEICSLQWGDVRQEEGVWCFDITKAKSEAGVRTVPVHSKLVWLMDRRSEDPKDHVWPELAVGGPDKKHSWKFTGEFTKHRRLCGVDDVVGRYRKSFHSFRKNATRCFELAHVPQNAAAEIIGHERAGLTYRVYNPEGLPMADRKVTVEKIIYPDLDFSHLIED